MGIFRNTKLKLIKILSERSGYIVVIIVFIGYLLFLLSSALKVNFMQNDDWCYYKNVENFLLGNFNLIYRTAPVFYLQGLLGSLFTKVFDSSKIPLLTLIISIACLGCLFFILKVLFKKSTGLSLITVLVLSVCPLFVYSSLGFMTENYFVFLCSFQSLSQLLMMIN